MKKFHINNKGVPSLCQAKKGNCPYGGKDGNQNHYDTINEAQAAIDALNEQEFGSLPAFQESKRTKDFEQSEVNLEVFSEQYLQVINRLNDEDFEAYFVGGSLRDAIIGLEVNDIDITTNATPEQVMEVFSDHKIIPIGIEHGTVAVMIDDEPVEITTFRQDGDYSDGRRPDEVHFAGSLKEDVDRRDFTMNALAYNTKDGIVDLVNGMEDIDNKLIRAVGSADKRFKEDPLRIMRGLRFSSKLGFDIEPDTKKAIFDNKELLKSVSAERLQQEFNGLIMGDNSKEVLTEYSSVISQVVPEIEDSIGFNQKNPNHIYDVWEHSSVVVNNANKDLAHKLAGVFHDIGKSKTFTFDEDKQVGRFFGHAKESVKIADKAMRGLKYPNKLRERVLNIVEDHDENLSTKPYKVKRNVYEKGPERFFDMIEFKRADDSAKNPSKLASYTNYDKIEKIARDFLANEPILSHKDLAISPKDVVDLGFKGEQIGKALNELCLMVISGHKNDRESQIEYLKKHGIK